MSHLGPPQKQDGTSSGFSRTNSFRPSHFHFVVILLFCDIEVDMVEQYKTPYLNMLEGDLRF